MSHLEPKFMSTIGVQSVLVMFDIWIGLKDFLHVELGELQGMNSH